MKKIIFNSRIYNYTLANQGSRAKRGVLIISLVLFLGIGITANADTVGQKQTFYIDSNYDLSQRQELTAVLAKVTPKLYFYIDEKWWNFSPRNEIYQALSELGQEFESNIYNTLIPIFGPEWNPGIDKDSRITILIHSMKESAGGYFRSNDEYSKLQINNSNEREMIYLNSEHITSNLAKSFLAHEFTHLITFNQKENTYNTSEEIWLNEARAEYAPTLVGYDDIYKGSNLEKKVQIFIDNPSDSIIDWQNQKADYGSIALFIQYLVDHYGIEILVDSLHSSKTGIESINYALEKNGFEQDFSQIFLDYTIAILINDCNYGDKYCYLNPNLRTFHITPRINFLPLRGESTLTFADLTKNWSGNWYKIIGGRGALKFKFTGGPNSNFKVPYITTNKAGGYNVKFLELDKNRTEEIYMEDFGTEIISLFFIPSIQDSFNNEVFYSFSWSASIEKPEEDNLINNLLAKIELLKTEIIRIQAKINAILNKKPLPEPASSCSFNTNLYYELSNEDVKCLQNFLKSQGPEIYPEGLVTGNFLSLTKAAVIRFQEKYASEILTPLGLFQGTGFVGLKTRTKIKELNSLK